MVRCNAHLFVTRKVRRRTTRILSRGCGVITVIVFYVDHFIYALVLGCIGPKRLLGILTVTTSLYILKMVFLRGVCNVCYLMNISTYVSLVFPAVCNVTLGKVNSSTGFNTTKLVVTVLNKSMLPPLRTTVVSYGAL